jgi:YidC/Oxa1 family membrane protein insertase
MEKRVLVAVILSLAVLYLYQAFFPPPKPVPAPAPAADAGPATPAVLEAPAPDPVRAEAAAPEQSPLVGDTAEREVVFDSPFVRATFSNRGGTLKSWVLKRYKDNSQGELDLVPQIVRGAPRPFTLVADDGKLSGTLRNAIYHANAESITQANTPQTLSFEYRDTSGLEVKKEFTFDPSHPYVLGFNATVTQNGTPVNTTVQFGPALGSGVVERSGSYNPPPQPIFYRDGSVTRVKPSNIQKSPNEEGTFGFVGVDDHYFLTAALPSPERLHVEYQPVSVPVAGSTTGANFVSWSTRSPGQAAISGRYFMGPKDVDVLGAVDPNLVRAIDFGKFSWLVVPLLRALKWVNTYLGNYGWSIIALTVLINLVMFPLRHKSVVSMRKMQELQPEVKAIQDRYAKLKMSDPAKQKMNVELMNLYRERGVNPASGCVPMLLTLPVLFAFYAMLSVAIELRGAPFVGWIHDLSAHDPLYITPVLMGITMFVQQRMTPSTADPVQQKMMMFMPLVFTSMFVWAPSGLVLYWTVSNLWAIGQQTLTNRLIAAPHRSGGSAGERRLKSAGAGRSEQASKERQ